MHPLIINNFDVLFFLWSRRFIYSKFMPRDSAIDTAYGRVFHRSLIVFGTSKFILPFRRIETTSVHVFSRSNTFRQQGKTTRHGRVKQNDFRRRSVGWVVETESKTSTGRRPNTEIDSAFVRVDFFALRQTRDGIPIIIADVPDLEFYGFDGNADRGRRDRLSPPRLGEKKNNCVGWRLAVACLVLSCGGCIIHYVK